MYWRWYSSLGVRYVLSAWESEEVIWVGVASIAGRLHPSQQVVTCEDLQD